MMPIMKVDEPGLHTTVQDTGRYGSQEFGIVPAGPMDPYAFKIANLLVGNHLNDAAIEMTMIGPSITFMEDTVIAVTGGHLTPVLGNTYIPLWTSIHAKKGDTLRFGKPQYGARAYLAIAGGILTEKVMGSRATYTKAMMGGLNGAALETGDHLPGTALPPEELERLRGKKLSHRLRPFYQSHHMVRVVPDEEASCFTEESLSTFYTHSYKITPQSDRMGYRIEGKKVERRNGHDMLSSAVAFGSIQIPGDGAPIILMADRQTAGGYPKVGTIISHDLWKVAQLLSGQTLSFQKSSVEEGHRWLEYERKLLKQLKTAAHHY